MLKNYFKVAWRHLLQNKGLSFINIFGLATGMAFAILIGLWIQYETSFDTFHVNADRIALVRKNVLFNNEKGTNIGTMLPLHDALKTGFPEVERASRLDWGNKHSLIVGDNKFYKEGFFTDPESLQMFSFPLIKGDARTALNDPNSIILTQSLATALFGSANPIGKMVKMDNQYNMMVSAVAADVPKNSSLSFEFLAPFGFKVLNENFVKNNQTNWGNNFLINLVELKPGVSMAAFSKKIGPLAMQKDKNLKNQTLFLQPFKQWHLYSEYKNWVNVGGKIDYVRLFGIIGIFVLLIACINFMNLSTARSEKRAREVGIRKAVGSRRAELILQFLSESMLTAFIAFVLALLLIQGLLPFLKDLGFENIHFSFTRLSLLAGVLAVCLITGLIAGSYPALYLSSFLPVKVLKGTLQQGRGTAWFRKGMVISQFVISIVLIISTVIVFRQISHARNRYIGYDPNNLITVGSSRDLEKNYPAFKHDLLNTGYIESVAKASSPMTASYNSWGDFSWEGKDPALDIAFDVVMTEWDYEKTAGLKFIQGRPFSKAFTTDSNAVVLNEAALKTIGYKDPLGKTMKLNNQTLTIIGITENVVRQDPFRPVAPAVIIFSAGFVSDMLIRLRAGVEPKKALAVIQPITEKYNPAFPFEYKFVDEEFAKKFTTENQVAKLAAIFAGLAIFISCLGLFGLAAFMAERRTKEIGIRKVLGATVSGLWMLLSKEFVFLVLLACLIASPLALLLMKNWLRQYDYRIDIGWWIFGIAALLALLIAICTVSFQAIKAALANPVKSLRTE